MSARRDEMLKEMGLTPIWRTKGTGGPVKPPVPIGTGGPANPPGPPGTIGTGGPVNPPGPPVPPGGDAEQIDVPSTPSVAREARISKMDWPALKAAVSDCTACALHEGRTQTVFGVGDENADWLLVGEAPGQEEDRQGEPFVGQAGQLLDAMLASIDLRRGQNVYIANVLKCRPPGNRNPEPAEVAQCAPHLARQVALIRPKLILAMGRFAVQTLLGTEASIASLRGRLHTCHGVPLIVTYHPAYLLRTLPDKAKAWQDLLFAKSTMAGLQASATAAI